MSSPACAEGYDTPAQQREDSTTFMVTVICIIIKIPRARLRVLGYDVTPVTVGQDSPLLVYH